MQAEDAIVVGTTVECSATFQDPNDDEFSIEYVWRSGENVVANGPRLDVNVAPATQLTCTATATDSYGYEGSGQASVDVLNRCGDGFAMDDEACDDGNLVEGDGCDTNCTVTACGNGIQSADEECDDGNALDDDLCRADCSVNAAPVIDEMRIEPDPDVYVGTLLTCSANATDANGDDIEFNFTWFSGEQELADGPTYTVAATVLNHHGCRLCLTC